MAARAARGQSSRTLENPQQSQARLQSDRLRHRVQRASENSQQSQARLQSDRLCHRVQRASETPQQSQTRQEADQLRYFRQRASTWADMLNAAFHYNPALNYEQFTFLQIGHMDKQCLHCTAFKYNGERLECAVLQVQGQVYHRIGSVLPPLNSDSRQLQPAFLQVFFIGDSSAEVATRHRNFPITKPHIVNILQDMLHRHNPYVHLFKASIEKMPSPDYKFVIMADKAPPGHHPRTFNAPTINEVAIVIVQENCDRRDIVLSKRGSSVQRINVFHRSYDALQYPLVFWNGQDGYHFHIPQLIDGVPSAHKTVSCMDFYASLLMIRSRNPGITNWLLAFGDLTHQILVDIYAKVESERLHYISAHQAQLRATEYINLLDAIRTDRSRALIGRQVILPSSFVGSPRHMHEYAQDCMAYLRKYGRPDLFITFTCNPEWPEIKLMQFPTQGAFVRHDLVARIFQLKVTKLIDLITKGDVFGKPQCWCYTIEWQKRGLPHAHILLWLKEKICPYQIDSIICAEIPNEEVDASLFRTLTKNIIHGPCGHGYPNPGCMERGRCQKKYPRLLLAETQTDRDRYPLYRRRRPEEGGFSFVKRLRVFTIENGVQVVRMTNVTIDNRYVVPYSPLLCRLFDAHINVESCASISAIKYICKYIYKGSDQSIFAVTGAQTESNEVLEYQHGRYISSNEAVWRILGFPIHRRLPMVQHLSVHLENGQRVYFTSANAELQAHRPPKTTLTESFALCQRDNFAKTLLYVEVPVYYIWSAYKSWQPRKQGTRIADQVAFASDAIGRVYTVHPNFEECFYLRMLLHSVRGPTSFAALRTINGSPGLSLIVWVVSGLLCLVGALCYAEMGTSILRSGGDSTYIQEAFGKLPGFLYIWVAMIVIMPCNKAIAAMTFAQYILKPFSPLCALDDNAIRAIAAATIIFLTFINCVNVKWVNKLQAVFTIAKVVSLVFIICTGAYVMIIGTGHKENFVDAFKNSATSPGLIAAAIYQGMFSYSGWNHLNFVTEELKDPYKNLPRAIGISITSIILIYTLTNAAYFAVLTPKELLDSEAVAITFGEKVLSYVSWIMPLSVAISTFGYINGAIYTSSRLFFVGGREGLLPQSLSTITIAFKTPAVSLIFTNLITLAYLCTTQLYVLIEHSQFIESGFYFLSVLSMLWLRWKRPDLERPIRVPLVLPGIFVILCIFLLGSPFYTNLIQTIISMSLLLIGIPVYLVGVRWERKPLCFRKGLQASNHFIQKLMLSVAEEKEEENPQ
ncbi:hypothetical protein LAZ67_2006361 [Cordylochernes scorpioides]|uniref:Helitron helicase-like domain-containing protein n=1 Tax=Cordylochernes scorpioides TaxID=51811 RepID=A0ABY6K6T2_9ARAC|nr:hypothetical protein LAZ67_2006361 [Cordylochernes scorpioides]